MFVEYWNFISRELPSNPYPTAMEVIPDFVRKTVLWSLFFSILHIAFPFIARTFFPKWFSNLSARDRKDIGSYVVCTVHHLAMVPLAWVHIYRDFLISAEAAPLVQYAVVEASVAPFVIGYLAGDTICYAIPEMFHLRFEFIVHHVLTLYLIVTSLTGPGYFCRYIPHLIICDTTNIFFNFAWLLRRVGMKGSSLVTALEVTFACAFFCVRAVNLPLVFLQAMSHPTVSEWGLAQYTLLPIVLMQWYWFSRIVVGIAAKLRPAVGPAVGAARNRKAAEGKSKAKNS